MGLFLPHGSQDHDIRDGGTVYSSLNVGFFALQKALKMCIVVFIFYLIFPLVLFIIYDLSNGSNRFNFTFNIDNRVRSSTSKSQKL